MTIMNIDIKNFTITMVKPKLKNRDFIVRNGVKLFKNKDIFKINNKWMEKKDIVIDNYTGEKFPKNNHRLISARNLRGSIVYTSKTINCDGEYFCASCLADPDFENIYVPHLVGGGIFASSKYIIPASKSRNRSIYSFASKRISPTLPKGNVLDEILNKYSYGFEIETSNGEVEDKVIHDFGFTTVYDGSIGGHELVSKPLLASELINVQQLVSLLPYSCSIDRMCSLHIHIGSIPRTETNLIKLYDIYYKLQDELWSLVPPYKKEISYLKNLEKDYVKTLIKLPSLTTDNILKFFSLPTSFSRLKELSDYLNSSQKWTIRGRYHFINFINYICKSEGTIEIRLLQSTFNYKLIETWLLINTLIIDYALNNPLTEPKTKISLEDVVRGSSLNTLLKDKLIYNIVAIKDIYFNAYLNRTNFQNNLEDIDRIMQSKLEPLSEELKIVKKTPNLKPQLEKKSSRQYYDTSGATFYDNALELLRNNTPRAVSREQEENSTPQPSRIRVPPPEYHVTSIYPIAPLNESSDTSSMITTLLEDHDVDSPNVTEETLPF